MGTLAQGHTASKQSGWVLTPHYLIPKPMLFLLFKDSILK